MLFPLGPNDRSAQQLSDLRTMQAILVASQQLLPH